MSEALGICFIFQHLPFSLRCIIGFWIFAFPIDRGRDVLLKIVSIPMAVFMTVMVTGYFSMVKNTTLYIMADGVGVQYRRGDIKKIFWDNLENWDAERSEHLIGFRFKSYRAWLGQFSEAELRDRAQDRTILERLFAPFYRKQTSLPDNIRLELEQISTTSAGKLWVERMIKQRAERSVDLILSNAICTKYDREIMKLYYSRWKADQEPNKVGS